MSPDGFASADARKGFSAEIRVQVLSNTDSTRGIDFEAYVGDGAKDGLHHFISITRTGIYCFGRGRQPLAEGLNNHSAMHTYRLAVWPDGTAYIYRDRALITCWPRSRGVDPLIDAHGPYLQWGDGAISDETKARVEHVAYDLAGPFGPEPRPSSRRRP